MSADSKPISPDILRHWREMLSVPFSLAGITTAVAWYFAGDGLGMFFGGIIAATVLAPGLILSESGGWKHRILIAGAVADGVGMVWLISLFVSPITLAQGLRGYLLLIAWVGALAGMVAILERLTRSRAFTAAVTTLGAAAWIGWPIWLAPALQGTARAGLVQRMAAAHPLLVMNSVIPQEGYWIERTYIYHLVSLNQDVALSLPSSIWPAVMIYLALAGLAGLIVYSSNGGWGRWIARS